MGIKRTVWQSIYGWLWYGRRILHQNRIRLFQWTLKATGALLLLATLVLFMGFYAEPVLAVLVPLVFEKWQELAWGLAYPLFGIFFGLTCVDKSQQAHRHEELDNFYKIIANRPLLRI